MKLWKLHNTKKDSSIFYIDISYKYACIELFGSMVGIDF